MTTEQAIEHLNSIRPPFLDALGCTIQAVDLEQNSCTMDFEISEQFCHSGNIVQGGFVTSMLDTVCAHATFLSDKNINLVASLEIKVSFLKPTIAGRMTAIGRVDQIGGSIAFLSSKLFDESGILTDSATTTAKIKRG